MTTTDVPSKFRYEGNGVTDTFAFTGRIFAAEDLIVEIILRADDSLVDTLTLTTDYSVTINGPSSASVVVTAPNIPSGTQDIQLRRGLTQSQSLVLPTGTVFPAKSVETALDKATALIQDLEEVVNRSIKLPAQTSATAGIAPEPEDDKILAWDGTTGLLKNGPTTASFTDATNTAVAAAATATTQAGIATTQAGLASTSATNAGLQVDYAEEWAQNPEDDPVSVAAGGDNSTTYSALHWAAKAEDFAQSINLPALGAADTVLQVNGAGNALEYGKVAVANMTSGAATIGQVATADGAGNVAFGDAAGGGWNPIATQNAVADTEIDFTSELTSTYDDYRIDYHATVSADNDPMFIRLGNGGVFDTTSGDYKYAYLALSSNNSNSYQYNNSTTTIQTGGDIGNDTGEGVAGTIYIRRSQLAGSFTLIDGVHSLINNGGEYVTSRFGGVRAEAAVHDRIRLYLSSGGSFTGRFTISGRNNA